MRDTACNDMFKLQLVRQLTEPAFPLSLVERSDTTEAIRIRAPFWNGRLMYI